MSLLHNNCWQFSHRSSYLENLNSLKQEETVKHKPVFFYLNTPETTEYFMCKSTTQTLSVFAKVHQAWYVWDIVPQLC